LYEVINLSSNVKTPNLHSNLK